MSFMPLFQKFTLIFDFVVKEKLWSVSTSLSSHFDVGVTSKVKCSTAIYTTTTTTISTTTLGRVQWDAVWKRLESTCTTSHFHRLIIQHLPFAPREGVLPWAPRSALTLAIPLPCHPT